jgi:O-antigen/teichoic acid export membrane protein
MKLKLNLLKNNLFKISFYNAASLLVKLLVGFISSKAIAYFIGPSGIVFTANLRNFLSISENIGLMGLQNSLVIEVAQNKDNKEKLHNLLQTLFVFFSCCSFFLVVLVLIFYSFIASQLMLNEYRFVVILAAFFIPFQIFYIYFLQILNGLEAYKKLYLTHIFGNIIYVLISVFLMWQYGILGGLISVLVAPFILFWVVFYFIKAIDKSFINFKNFNFSIIKSLIPITIMILFTTVFSQMMTLEIRKTIILSCSINQAGYWEAMQRISSIYMMFFTSFITIYYLPKLSEILKPHEIQATKSLKYKKLLSQFYLVLIPLVLLTFGIIYIFKNEIILLVLNSEFSQVNQLFQWQLIGDFFKLTSSILALQFFIRKETKIYILLESISMLLYLFLAYYFIDIQEEVGATIGFAISNLVYFILVVLVRLKN